MTDRERLEEATELIERITQWRCWPEGGTSDDELQGDAKEWLSRAPAQPAAPTPHAWEDYCAAHMSPLPAAPEPSAHDYDSALRELASTQRALESAESQLAAVGEWTHRKGKALVPHGGWSDSFGDGMRNAQTQVSALLAPGLALLTAPIPGAGEETL